MTTSTPNLGLVLYNSTTDSAEYFSNFRAVIAGTSLTSNFYKIDTAYGSMQTEIDDIQAGAYFTLASYISANYYEATVTGVTSYNIGMKIILSLNTASAGTVTLNINSLGIKSVMKIDSTGTPVNISGGELMVGKYYFFAYDGTRWVWVDSTSGDQSYISGTVGNLLKINTDNTLVDSTYSATATATASKIPISDGSGKLDTWISDATSSVKGKASIAIGSEVDTGTNDTKIVTAKAINDSHNVPSVAPSTAGNILTSDGTDWISSAPVATGGLPAGYIYGLGLSNNATDATNDIDIAVGKARDITDTEDMILASALTKRLDAAWAVGTNQGGLDTGSIANTTYHVWLIKRSDTDVVDALFSTSATSPTMPTNYDYKRRIGSIIRLSAAIKAFHQDGDNFVWDTPIRDIDNATLTTSSQTETLTVPNGIVVNAMIVASGYKTGDGINIYVRALDQVDLTPAFYTNMNIRSTASSENITALTVKTNTSSQIGARADNTVTRFIIITKGWIDARNRL